MATTFAYDRTQYGLSFSAGTTLPPGTHLAKMEARGAAGNPRTAQRTLEVVP